MPGDNGGSGNGGGGGAGAIPGEYGGSGGGALTQQRHVLPLRLPVLPVLPLQPPVFVPAELNLRKPALMVM